MPYRNGRLTGGPDGPFCPGGPGAPMGTSPYSGHTAAQVRFTELANVDICSNTTCLQTSITCWAESVGPWERNYYHMHYWLRPSSETTQPAKGSFALCYTKTWKGNGQHCNEGETNTANNILLGSL